MQAIRGMGDVFATIAVREPQPRASEAFRLFGEQHRNMERLGVNMLQSVKPVSIQSYKILILTYWPAYMARKYNHIPTSHII